MKARTGTPICARCEAQARVRRRAYTASSGFNRRPQYRRRAIGKAPFGTAGYRFADVRMFHVVADANDPVDNGFYRSFGMKQLAEGGMVSYFR